MSGDRDVLLLLQDVLDIFVIDILNPGVVLDHDGLDSLVIPDRLIAMEFIVLGQHFYLLGELAVGVLPLHILLIVVEVVIFLELNEIVGQLLVQNLFDVLGVVEVLGRGVLARQGL